jgi:hypothetical protein
VVVEIHNIGNIEDLLSEATEEALSLSDEVGQTVRFHLSKDFMLVERVTPTKQSLLFRQRNRGGAL